MALSPEKQHLLDLVELTRSKIRYEDALKRRKSLGGLRRILSARPVDPAPGHTCLELASDCKFAFQRAFPSLHDRKVAANRMATAQRFDTEFRISNEDEFGAARLYATMSDFSKGLRHTEYFESDGRSGFIHEYDHGSDLSEKEREERALNAQRVAVNDRGCLNAEATSFYCSLDSFCRSDFAVMLCSRDGAGRRWSNKEVEALVKDIMDYRHSVHAWYQHTDAVKKETMGRYLVTDVWSYVRARAEMFSIADRLVDNKLVANDADIQRARYEGLETMTLKLSPVEVFRYGKKYQESETPKFDLDSLWRYSRNSVKAHTQKRVENFGPLDHSDANHAFIEAALLGGYEPVEISRYIGENTQKDIFPDIEYNFVLFQFRAARAYQEALEAVASKESKGEACPHPPFPIETISAKMEDAYARSRVFDWMEEKGFGFTHCNHDSTRYDLGRVAKEFVKSDLYSLVPFGTFCSQIEVSQDSFLPKVYEALENDFKAKLKTDKGLAEASFLQQDGRSLNYSATLLRDACFDIMEHEPGKLGEFLFDAGIRTQKGQNLASTFSDVGRRISQGSLYRSSLSLEQLWEKHHETFGRITSVTIRKEAPQKRVTSKVRSKIGLV